MYRISIVNIRQIVDWAEQQERINKNSIGLLGISYGGFISAITMGIDSRIKSCVLIVMGGNAVKIGNCARRLSIRKNYGIPPDEYCRLLENYSKFLEEVEQRGLDAVKPESISFLNDPLTYAGRLRQRPIYMINAMWDELIPREATLDFWEATGKPRITWLPAAHASIWAYYPLIRSRIYRFYRQSFKEPEKIKVK